MCPWRGDKLLSLSGHYPVTYSIVHFYGYTRYVLWHLEKRYITHTSGQNRDSKISSGLVDSREVNSLDLVVLNGLHKARVSKYTNDLIHMTASLKVN